MDNFYARTVFFTTDAGKSLDFYSNKLGFALDWNHKEEGKPYVLQVSLFGFELILNQVDMSTAQHAGHGRVFIGLDDAQSEILRNHIEQKQIQTTTVQWGKPTLVIKDPDGNELYFTLG
jgi:catechol 2,3-dioxygenase-like lactoylglutathione lyase family enzyme